MVRRWSQQSVPVRVDLGSQSHMSPISSSGLLVSKKIGCTPTLYCINLSWPQQSKAIHLPAPQHGVHRDCYHYDPLWYYVSNCASPTVVPRWVSGSPLPTILVSSKLISPCTQTLVVVHGKHHVCFYYDHPGNYARDCAAHDPLQIWVD